MPDLKKYAKLITAAFSAFAAVNGVYHFLPDPTVNQIGYGIEFCSTGGGKARFTLSDFSVTMS